MNDSIPDILLKQCKICQQWFPLTKKYWHSHPGGKDGYKNRCITCYNAVRSGRLIIPVVKIPEGHKKCSKCGQIISISEFFRDKYRHDGLYPSCKDCFAKSQGTTRQPKKEPVLEGMKRCGKDNDCVNPFGPILPRTAEFFARDKIYGFYSYCKVCQSQKLQLYGQANREKLRQKRQAYRQNNVESIREKVRRWGKVNVQKKIVNNQRRKARKQSLPDTFTESDWQQATDYFHGCCAICGRQLNDMFGQYKASMDHWIPLSSPDCPGTVPTNIIPLCHGIGGCNNSKGHKNPADWLIEYWGKPKAKMILIRINAYFDWVLSKK